MYVFVICVNGYVRTCVGLCACGYADVSSGWNVGIVRGFEGPFSGLSHGPVLSLHLNLMTVKQHRKLLSSNKNHIDCHPEIVSAKLPNGSRSNLRSYMLSQR